MNNSTRLFTATLLLLSSPVFLPLRSNAQDVIMQGFYWNTHPGDVTNTTTGGIWWDTLAGVASQLGSSGAGFSAVWTPPPTKSFAGVWDMGYGTYDYFDLGSYFDKGTTRTRHGNRAEMDAALAAIHSNGMKAMCDVVLNHRGGSAVQAPYEFGGGQGYIIFNPASQRVKTTAANARWFHQNNLHNGANDYYSSFFFEDVCHFTDNDANPPANATNNNPGSWYFGTPASPGIGAMGDSMIMWGRWLVNEVGFDEIRLDAVKHVEPDFIAKWLVETKNGNQPFAVGELFDANPTVLRNYWNAVQNSANAGGVKAAKISMFDFALRERLRDVLNATGNTQDIYQKLVGQGLVLGTDMGGYDVVTWLDNHDTDRLGYEGDSPGCAIPYGATCLKLGYSSGHDPVSADKEDMGYPYILAAEGRPTVFWKDWYWYNLAKDIKWQMALRAYTATGTSDDCASPGPMSPDWTVAGYTVDNNGGNMFALRRNGLTGGVSDGMVLGLNDDDDREHAMWVNTPFTNKYLKDYSDGYLFQTTQAFGDTRAVIKAQKRDYSWWSVTGLYPRSPGTAASHFNMNATPGGCPHFIALRAADAANLIVNGAPIAAGDEVAVKNAAGQVVGIGRIGQQFKWDGVKDMIIEVLGAPSSNGMANGEAFRVFVWDASASTETEIGTVQYAASGSTFNFSPDRGNSPNRNGGFSTFPVTTTATGTFSCQGISRIVAFNTQLAVSQPFCAGDQADAATYNGGWTNGSNGGTGFGAWSLSGSANSGFFIGSSANNGDGDGNANGDINTAGEAFGIYANSGQTANAVRSFGAALPAGTVFSLKMDNGWIESGGTVGFGLQNSSGENLFEFYFRNGQSDYKTNDLTNEHNTGIGFTDEGLSLQFTLQTATTYQLVVTPLGGSSSTFTGSLKNPAGGQSISQVRLYNVNAGSGGQRDAFFNSLSVCYPATLVINEVDYDQSGTDAKEFIELKNVSGAAVNLDNYKLELVDGGSNTVYRTVDLPNVNLEAGDYYVICGNGSGVANCDFNFDGAVSDRIQNGAPDAIRLLLNNTLTVDALSYEGSVTGAVESAGNLLNDDGTAPTQNLGLSRTPDGDDTNNNNNDFVLTCLTPGTANTGNTDADADGRPDPCDNCPNLANNTQADTDIDGQGNVCDACPLAVSGIANFNTATCNCEPGYYPVTEVRNGQTVVIGCQPCPAGSYCPDGINVYACPAGKYSNVTGSTVCLNCPAGSYSDVTGSTICQSCPAGKYQGLEGQTTCLNCPAGKYSDQTGSTICQSCPAGKYQGLEGQTSCLNCPAGKYSDQTGSTECQSCPAGKYQGLEGQTSCLNCPAGKYSDQTGSTECQSCPAGKYQGLEGQTTCLNCPAGKYSDQTGSTECQSCPAGKYQGLEGQTTCLNCPAGKYSDQTGSTECQSCAAGYYQDQTGQTSCAACPPGKYSSTEGAVSCQNCSANTYSANYASTGCDNCGSGYYSPPGSASCSVCNLSFTATPTDESCGGAMDGQIVVSGVTGGSAPFQYSIDNGATYQSSATFTGLSAGTYPVRVKDGYLCESAASNVVIAEDNCPVSISGKVIWQQNGSSGVKDVTVKLEGDAVDTKITLADGLYAFPGVNGANFTLKPSKNLNKTNGLNTADASAIQQHLAGIAPITNLYKLLAADVNKSNSITSLDATVINQSLLGNASALAQFKASWRFVPVSHVMTSPPWSAPENITLSGVSGNVANQNFYGIKMGDLVTDFANPANFGAGEPLVLYVQDRELSAGETVRAEFRAGQLNDLAAFQLALRFDPQQLSLEDAQPLGGLPLTADNFGLNNAGEGEVRLAWSQAVGAVVEEAAPLFALTFKTVQGGVRLSGALDLDDDLLPARAYSAALAGSGVKLKYVETTGTGPAGGMAGYRLLQNVPNPFSEITTIPFVLPGDCDATLRVFDVDGRLLREYTAFYGAGRNTVEVDLKSGLESGVYYYELTTRFGVLARKMVVAR